MQVKTEAFFMGYQPIHSNKTNKDYYKLSMVIDGGFASFIVPAKKGADIIAGAGSAVSAFEKTHQPVKVNALLNIDFTDRGNFIGIEEFK